MGAHHKLFFRYQTIFVPVFVLVFLGVPLGTNAQEASTSSVAVDSEELVEDPVGEDLPFIASSEEIIPLSSSGEDGEIITNEEILAMVVFEEEPVFEGMTIEELKTAPGAFGIFWRGVRERISLALTRDPVAKAEKAIQFAEERIRIAEKIVLERTDTKAQQRAEQVIERATALIERAQEKQEEWEGRGDERVARLLKNIANHRLRRGQALDRIEAKLPQERREAFTEKREELAERSKAQRGRLQNAINNENIPQDIRNHLKNIQARIEAHAEEVGAFQEKRQELRAAIQAGEEEAIQEFEQLRSNRQEQLEIRRNSTPERVKVLLDRRGGGDMEVEAQLNRIRQRAEADIRERIAAGDEEAARRLQELQTLRQNRVKLPGVLPQVREEILLKNN